MIFACMDDRPRRRKILFNLGISAILLISIPPDEILSSSSDNLIQQTPEYTSTHSKPPIYSFNDFVVILFFFIISIASKDAFAACIVVMYGILKFIAAFLIE